MSNSNRLDFVNWQISYACQLRCTHCYTESGRRAARRLPAAALFEIADTLIAAGVRSVQFTGGEPLLVPETLEIARRLGAAGVDLHLYTNGIDVTPALAREIVRLFPQVHVSVDGPTADVHDPIRGRAGAFDAAVAGLSALDAAAKDYRPQEGAFGFGVDVTLIRSNFDHIEELVTTFARRFAKIRFFALAAAIAVPCGLLAAALTGGGHTAIYVLLLSGGSAAVVLPALEEAGLLESPAFLPLIIQIALADVAAIVAVPLVLEPSRALHAALASVLVSACALLVYLVARKLEGSEVVQAVRGLSGERRWALDLRAALMILFALCWVALRSGTSILVAGFSAGLVVGALGGPSRLSTQVIGVAQGFFVPLFFVVLGARIDLRALVHHPSLFVLVGLLVIANVVVHVATAMITRQGIPRGVVATAQLGLPAAIVALGLRFGVLDAGRAAAIVAAGLCSLPIAASGARLLVTKSSPAHDQPIV